MNDTMIRSAGVALALAVAGTAQAQFLMVADSDEDRVMLFDAFDGSLVDANFIALEDFDPFVSRPWNAIQVDDEIWVNDNSGDTIYRVSLDGDTLLGEISGGFNDTRGMTKIGDRIYITNDGTRNDAPGDDTVVILDAATGDAVGGFALRGEPGDIFQVGNELFITNQDGNTFIGDGSDDTVDVYDLAGNYLRTFIDLDGSFGNSFGAFSDPQQLAASSNGFLLATEGFSNGALVELDIDGNILDTILMLDLPNIADKLTRIRDQSNILFTVDNTGVFVSDRDLGVATLQIEGDPFYIENLIPSPSALVLFAGAGVLGARRRR